MPETMRGVLLLPESGVNLVTIECVLNSRVAGKNEPRQQQAPSQGYRKSQPIAIVSVAAIPPGQLIV